MTRDEKLEKLSQRISATALRDICVIAAGVAAATPSGPAIVVEQSLRIYELLLLRLGEKCE